MDESDFPEESLHHVEALLARHNPQAIQRMFQQVMENRRNSMASSFASSSSSLYSRLSVASSFSTSSSDYPPSIASSTSSRLQSRRREPTSYPSGLNPTRPGPSVQTPASDISSPMDLAAEQSVTPTDEDLNSTASPLSFPNEAGNTQSGASFWFCTFCAEEKILKTFRAKSDWKKHEMRMHETGEDWPCPAPGCSRIFSRNKDFAKHYQRHHAGRPLLSPNDVRIQLLPQKVFGCGFDKCKEVSIGWDERCDHVAKHMKNGFTSDQWRYPNVIRNLIRQEATHRTWKEIVSTLGAPLRQIRSQISWCPDNTRVLKQKLECCDLRPSRDEVLITALSLRSDLPMDLNEIPIPMGFVTPSLDSVPDYNRLSPEQLMQTLNGDPAHTVSQLRIDALAAALYKAGSSTLTAPQISSTSFFESDPSPIQAQAPPQFNEPVMTDATGRRISYMDIDGTDFLLAQPDPEIPQIPPQLQEHMAQGTQISPPMTTQPPQEPGFIDPGRPSNPMWCYPNYFDAPPSFEDSQYYDRPSLGQTILRRVRSGLGSRRSHHSSNTPSPVRDSEAPTGTDFTVPHAHPGHPQTMRHSYRSDGSNDQLHLYSPQG